MSIEGISSHKLLDAVTGTGAGSKVPIVKKGDASATFQATANGTSGSFSATVDVEVSNNETDWMTMGTISLSGTATTANSDGFASSASWLFARGNVTAISGIGANVTLVMGV